MAMPDESVVHGSKASPQDLPAVDRLLRAPDTQSLIALHGHTLVAGEARALLRLALRRGAPLNPADY